MTRQQDVEPVAAFIATLAAMRAAARRTEPGRRKRSRRTARPRGSLGGRGRGSPARAFRDDGWPHPGRPADYVTVGIVLGSTGAFALVALGRLARAQPDGGPGGTQPWRSHLPRWLGSAGGTQDEQDRGAGGAGVTAMDPAARSARHASGAA